MRRSTRLWPKSRRGAMLTSRPTTLRVCRIWWPLQRFVGIIRSCLQLGRSSLSLGIGNFEDQPHHRRGGACTYGRRRPTSHETDRRYLREGVHRLAHSHRNSYRYLGGWVQPVRISYSATTFSTELSYYRLMVGTRIYGVQTLMCSDRNVGLKWTGKRNHPLGCMATCTATHGVPMVLSSIDLSFAQLYILRRRQGLHWMAGRVR